MSIPGAASPLFLATTAGAADAFEISRSLRFNSADSAYLNRTPSSASNRRTWTWSGWVKKININTYTSLFSAGNNPWVGIDFLSDQLSVVLNAGSGDVGGRSDALFRDLSAWYHIVVAVDTTQATAADRIKIYANGVELSFTANGDGLPSQNYDTLVNTAITHRLGADGRVSGGGIRYGDIYLADVNFIDGSALDPTSFGAFDTNGVWQAKDTAGLTFGTNGFRLKFADNSSSAALGTDSSGNSNTWTVNNITAQGFLYSSGVSGYLNSLPSNSGASLFDGNTSNNFLSSTISGSGIKFVPPIAITGSIELYLRNGDTDNTQMAYSLDGGSNFTNVTTVGGGGSYVSIGSQTITTTNGIIVRHITTAGTNSVNWRAIKVDGTVLVDGTPSSTDSLVDTPSNAAEPSDSGIGGEVAGNYCTMNPLDNGGLTLANGNLDVTMSTSAWRNCRATIGMTTGKWYFEVECKASTSGQGLMPGILNAAGSITTTVGANSGGYAYNAAGGNKYNNNVGSSYGATFDNGDIIGVAYDGDNGTITFYKNGASQGVAFTSIPSGTYFPAVAMTGTMSASINFGARSFAHTAPSGYKALNTSSLSTPTIADGSQYFDARSGLTAQFTISDLNFATDLMVAKSTSNDEYWIVADVVRNNFVGPLRFNGTNAEGNGAAITNVSATGYQSDSNWFTGGRTYATWNWDAGTSTVTNNDGSIASSVRAQPSAGFSIVKYQGDAPNNTIGHGLNAVPELVIIKSTTRTDNWIVYHSAIGLTGWLHLNATHATTNASIWGTSGNWTSDTFGVSTSAIEGNNYGSNDFIAYCFAPVAGYSAMGSYTGNANSDGPFVALSFRPAFIFIKNASLAGSNWIIIDTSRDTYNEADHLLKPNKTDQEQVTTANEVDILSNGFKPRGTDGDTNGSGNTMIYYAVAENPFQANGGLAR